MKLFRDLHWNILIFFIGLFFSTNTVATSSIAQYPLFLTTGAPPVVMLTMGRDHKLYYEAYNDASDLNDDGVLDINYKPDEIDYFGYFDSYKCYSYSSGLFSPVSQTPNKKCSGSWSGDFLNYITTSRIDAMRKVLYGGYRSTDTTSSTILTRSFIPQDAHSWGKEYTSVAVDGYDISEYTPLSLPTAGTRHLFANVSLSSSGQPLMRVLNDSVYRIWEWVTIERPVAGSQCNDGSGKTNCAKTSSGSVWQVVPSSTLSDLNRTIYDISGSWPVDEHPDNSAEYDSWESGGSRDQTGVVFGSGSMSTLQATGNPYGSNDYYFTMVTGKITVPTSGTYEFSVDGDDAIDVTIDGSVVASWYGGHGVCNCNTHSGTVYLTAGVHDIKYRHEEKQGGDSFVLRWNIGTVPASTISDYDVNVEVCKSGFEEENCRAYSDGSTTTYKPAGILQRYGEEELMAFGLLTSSYQKNTSGGVLRKNISSFRDEVDLNTGIFSNTSGIVDTIDKLKIARFQYPSTAQYHYQSGWITTRPINEGEAQDWGNPIAEMMYEGLRYFAGKSAATPDYLYGGGSTDSSLGLPAPAWLDPYRTTSGGYEHCSKPIQMVIGDINTSYDSDQLPGSYFNSFSETDGISGLNVSTLADRIWSNESEASNAFIGQSGANYDGTPTAKSVTSFSNIRGLSPEEPTKQGSYYAASVGLYGQESDINPVTGDQNVDTLAVALASPLPRIEIPVSGQTVTIVPFAKSVGGSSISANSGSFQPTNQIVDFYVETIANTGAGNSNVLINSGRPYGKFRINYEDVEQAADHDMDAIVEYEFIVNASNQLEVNLNSTYAAGGIIQHMGYVISGTTADGTYLEVRDVDTAAGSDPDYFLDTPPGQVPGGVWNDSAELPLSASRTFTVGSSTSASFIKHDPLWYAAKWASPERKDNPYTSQNEDDGNTTLDTEEWDSDGDGTPDGYFLVTNAGKLEDQLNKAFSEIVARTTSASAVATNSSRLDTSSKVYQAVFNSKSWTGDILAYNLDSTTGAIDTLDWKHSTKIPNEVSRRIYSYDPTVVGSKGIVFEYANLNSSQQTLLNQDYLGNTDSNGEKRADFIRGEDTNEGTLFRSRTTLLGDIVNSDPWFVGRTEDFGYSLLSGTEGSTYISYRAKKLSRKPALYFGANDGMLHAIDAETGDELFTYIPDKLIGSLNKLTSKLYGCSYSGCVPHAYFVDGPPNAADVYYGSDWHTVLVGTLGAGGKAIFAIDVSNPNPGGALGTGVAAIPSFSNTNILWELSDTQAQTSSDLAHFADHMGYTIGQASIVKMHNGKWAAIVGNGYESSAQTAVLFIIDIETGELMVDPIDTGVGSNANPNGLSNPVVIDADGDRIADYVYAGDLQGNLWKFDISNSNANQWDVAFKSGAIKEPLFIAKDSSGTVQPITGKPQVGEHPDGGLMIYFGTGKYFELNDDVVGASPQVQTFYGLRDQGTQISVRSDLQAQTIEFETTFASLSIDIRSVSKNSVNYPSKKGWYLDLISPNNGAEGERVVSTPLVRNGRVIFSTLIPEPDPCGWGGSSWIMELDAITGARLDTSAYDVNNDGVFDMQDLLAMYDTNGDGKIDIADKSFSSSGVRGHGVGILKTPSVVSIDNDTEVKTGSGSSGDLFQTRGDATDHIGRQSWRQIR